MNYRPDIDGLRAIAVLGVVLFHLDILGFSGGYIGVDVFFVISGYLITTIITGKAKKGEFSLSEFYIRRVRRLLPPLIATVAVTFLAAMFILTPYDAIHFSKSAVASLLSLSNIVFYLEADYWDSASELKPLLHTWSLGVEEQFYLFWPALVLVLLKLNSRIPFAISITVISILGGVLCVWFTAIDQSAAFYLLPFRVFQFSIGALAIPIGQVVWKDRKLLGEWTSSIFLIVGLILIVGSIYSMGEASKFPGWLVFFPTIGAMFVLLAGAGTIPSNSSLSKLVLANPLSVWIGRASYSMYLVHWPIISLWKYRYGVELDLSDQVILGVGTIILTFSLHYLVEKRFYQRKVLLNTGDEKLSDYMFLVKVFVLIGFLTLAPLSVWLGDGWSWRYPSLSFTSDDIVKGTTARYSEITCNVANLKGDTCQFDATTKILVIGDSHVTDGYNFLKGYLDGETDTEIFMFGWTNDCDKLTIENGIISSSTEICQQKRLEPTIELVSAGEIDAVLYVSMEPFSDAREREYKILSHLRGLDPKLKLVVLGPYLFLNRPCPFYVNQYGTTDACAFPENLTFFEPDPDMYEQMMQITELYIDRYELLCNGGVLQTCLTRTQGNIPVSYDQHHQSLEFAIMSGKLYRERYGARLLKLFQNGNTM